MAPELNLDPSSCGGNTRTVVSAKVPVYSSCGGNAAVDSQQQDPAHFKHKKVAVNQSPGYLGAKSYVSMVTINDSC